MNRRERYPANSIVGDSKDTKESTVPIIIIIIIVIISIIIIIINDLKWNVSRRGGDQNSQVGYT